MSLYRHLSIPVPVIAYCAMHQALPAVTREEYEKTMRELHGRIFEKTLLIADGYAKFVSDGIVREVENLRATLSQFLETPLSRDAQEIRRVLNESLSRVGDHVRGTHRPGLRQSTEGRFIFPDLKNATSDSLLQRGHQYLKQLKFQTDGDAGGVYESEFIIEGGENLDVLEFIVRDKLGIYATTHGKHIKEFAGYSYTVFNLVYQCGELASKPVPEGQLEVAIFFSKPDVKYAPLRAGLAAVLDRVFTELKIPDISVWQRKLGLGAGDEFVARMKCENIDQINRTIEWLWTKTEKAFVHEALVANGKLTIKEVLF